MFDLETAVRGWRLRLIAGGIRNRAVLRELESHLRDDIEALTAEGKDVPTAFERAAQHLGTANDLHREFDKIPPSIHLEIMKHKFLALLAVITLIAVELAFLLPALAHAKASGAFNPTMLAGALTSFVAFNALVFCGLRAWYTRSQAG